MIFVCFNGSWDGYTYETTKVKTPDQATCFLVMRCSVCCCLSQDIQAMMSSWLPLNTKAIVVKWFLFSESLPNYIVGFAR